MSYIDYMGNDSIDRTPDIVDRNMQYPRATSYNGYLPEEEEERDRINVSYICYDAWQ